jgi:hypothetical protein
MTAFMDWLVLLFVFPLVLLAAVALAGFAGCSLFVKPPRPEVTPATPSDLVATAVWHDQIDLAWNDNGTDTTSFTIRRTKNGIPIAPLQVDPATGGMPPISNAHSDPQLDEGTTYGYQVFALVESTDSEEGSNVATATTLAWQPAFVEGPTATQGTDLGNLANFCVVQRIPAVNINTGGPGVRLTLRGAVTAALQLNRVFISQVAPAGDPFDSAGDLVQVLFGGAADVLLPAGTTVVSDETRYSLDAEQDLLVAFDIGTPGVPRNNTVPGARQFQRQNASEAGVPDRTFPYAVVADKVAIVERIEVLA